jgi:hypothetical protein
MKTINTKLIAFSLISLLVGVVGAYQFLNEASFGNDFNSDQGYGQVSSYISTSTSVAVTSTAVFAANYEMNFRTICLRPSDYASSTVYLNQSDSVSRNIVGGGIVLSSSTGMCVVWDRNNPYFGPIRGITPAGSTTTLIIGEY